MGPLQCVVLKSSGPCWRGCMLRRDSCVFPCASHARRHADGACSGSCAQDGGSLAHLSAQENRNAEAVLQHDIDVVLFTLPARERNVRPVLAPLCPGPSETCQKCPGLRQRSKQRQ